MKLLKESPLLCIDEFGFVNHSQDEALITFETLDYRIQELLPTILVTNNTTEELKEIIDPRLLDRIKQALYEISGIWPLFETEKYEFTVFGKSIQVGTLLQGRS